MKKYNIKSDRPELDLEQVNKGMNFNEVLKKAGTPKNHFTKPLLILSATAVIVSGLIYLGLFSDTKKTPFVNPLLETNSNKPSVFVVNTEKDTVLHYKNGTEIRIPQGSFVDKDGKAVTGSIEIAYREFHNVGEIILSGIPMTYDSANTQFHFESAGMFEINGSKNGEVVFIKEGKQIEVAMISNNTDSTKFNQYYLDTIARNWKYMKEDRANLVDLQEEKTEAVHDTNTEKTVAMAKPHKFDADRLHFQITVDKEEFPELALYDDAVFEVLPETKPFSPRLANVDWAEANLERINGTEKYKITFINSDTSFTVVSQVVVGNNNSPATKKAYEKLYALYCAKNNQHEEQKKIEQEKVETEIKKNKEYVAKVVTEEEFDAAVARVSEATSESVSRTFRIAQFGFYNSDCPSSMPKGILVNAQYKNDDGSTIKVAKVYLVEKGKNALYDLYAGKSVSFNPAAENTLFVISKTGEIGSISADEFKSINVGEKKYTFKMKMEKKIMSPNEIIKMI